MPLVSLDVQAENLTKAKPRLKHAATCWKLDPSEDIPIRRPVWGKPPSNQQPDWPRQQQQWLSDESDREGMTGTLPDWVQTFLLHPITSLPSPLIHLFDEKNVRWNSSNTPQNPSTKNPSGFPGVPGVLLWVADPMCWSHLLSIAPRPLLWWDLPGHWKCHPKGLVGWSTRPCFQKPWSYKVWREQEFVEHENMQKKWCRNEFPVFRHD